MIEVELSSVFVLFLGLILFLYLGVWLFGHLRGRKKEAIPPPFQLQTCEYCAYTYLTKTSKSLSTCPQCSSFNQR